MYIEELTPLDLRVIARGRFQVLHDFKTNVATVKQGFITDLATVGRLGNLVLKAVNSTRAATLHDWLYTMKPRTRKMCDEIFRDTLISVDRVTVWRANAAYWAVRICAKSHYGRNL